MFLVIDYQVCKLFFEILKRTDIDFLLFRQFRTFRCVCVEIDRYLLSFNISRTMRSTRGGSCARGGVFLAGKEGGVLVYSHLDIAHVVI